MKAERVEKRLVYWRSDQRPDVSTDVAELAEAIAWADANPHVWDIVTHTKSKAFGHCSCEYIGWAQRSMEPEAILERVRHLHALVTGKEAWGGPAAIFAWRARFTFEHYRDPGFTGAFFRQHDGRHERLCMTLDYTPDTLEEVVDRFMQWCGRDYPTTHVTVGGTVVRLLGENGHG
jgi:hypothetical protein